MSQTDPFDLSPESQASLHHLSSLLHLFHHRNKNQHRHSIWWRHFSLFRRQLTHFLSELGRAHPPPGPPSSSSSSKPAPKPTHLARARQKALTQKLINRNLQRRIFWRNVLFPRVRDAFSRLIADLRFAVLGLVLFAVLAETSRVLGLTAEMEEMGQGEVERVLEEFGREEWGTGGRRGVGEGKEEEREDVGEVVARGEGEGSRGGVSGEEGKAGDGKEGMKGLGRKRGREDEGGDLVGGTGEVSMSEVGSKERKRSGEPRKKRKKKKNGDVIDDLFALLD